MDITITITRTQQGQISIHGPMQDRILMLGLLEIAKDLVTDWHKKQANSSAIVAPPPGLKVS